MTAGTWHPLALSASIAPGTSAGTALDGTEIAVWRDTAGQIHTWEDRCPHRGMKLSFGFVRGDHIACLYHGWQYDAEGLCRYIPAHPTLEVPKSICVRVWPVAEAGGMVWSSLGEAPPPPPVLPAAVPLRSLYLDRSLAAVAEHLRQGSALGGAAQVDGALATLDSPAGPLTIGLQSIARDRSALHITVHGTPGTEALVDLAFRAEALRRAVETAEAAA